MNAPLRVAAKHALLIFAVSVTSHANAADPDTRPKISIQKQQCNEAIHRGVEWIVEQQSPDGGWHSRTYGKMKPGAGNTALILEAISQVSLSDREAGRDVFHNGVTFLTKGLDEQGWIHLTDGPADYPVYSSALLITAIQRCPVEKSEELTSRLSRALLRDQRTESNGWAMSRVDRGGWGPWREEPSNAESETPANISVTKDVLHALQAAGSLTPEVKVSALSFLQRCQSPDRNRGDAGFAFTPQGNSPLNKAGFTQESDGRLQPRPYHSATCDGINALLTLGVPESDQQLSAALTVLSQATPPRFLRLPLNEEEEITPQSALCFYDAATFSYVWQRTHDERLAGQRTALIQNLLEHQRDDGSWSNPIPWFHEDDPLIATALAVIALSQLSL